MARNRASVGCFCFVNAVMVTADSGYDYTVKFG